MIYWSFFGILLHICLNVQWTFPYVHFQTSPGKINGTMWSEFHGWSSRLSADGKVERRHWALTLGIGNLVSCLMDFVMFNMFLRNNPPFFIKKRNPHKKNWMTDHRPSLFFVYTFGHSAACWWKIFGDSCSQVDTFVVLIGFGVS